MKMITDTSRITIGEGADKKEFEGSISFEAYENAQDVLSKLQETSKDGQGNPVNSGLGEILDLLNAAIAARNRSKERARLVALHAGPYKAIQQMAKQLFKAREAVGKPITMDKALSLAKALAAQDGE